MGRFGISMYDAGFDSDKWCEDAIEELLDAACYLEKLRHNLIKSKLGEKNGK